MNSLDKARLSLAGLSVGDAFGELFFRHPGWIAERRLPPGPWPWTDDTQMALSIVAVLAGFGQIEQDALARDFAQRYHDAPHRGYGGGARRLLTHFGRGEDWRTLAPQLFSGGSYGNGAAMRVAPLGAFFAPDLEQAARQARLSAEITHAHPEGVAGAVAVAVGAALAAGAQPPRGQAFLEAVLERTPAGLVKAGLRHALDLPPGGDSGAAGAVSLAARVLGTGERVSAQDTVPFCLWCAAHHLDDYAEALWTTAAGLGDRDTTCAIVGGIVAIPSGGPPAEWLARREPLPELPGL